MARGDPTENVRRLPGGMLQRVGNEVTLADGTVCDLPADTQASIDGIETDVTATLALCTDIDANVDDVEVLSNAILALVTAVEGYTEKIDNLATDGLAGVPNSLAYRVHEIERHFHGRERWWGALAVPDETNAIEANVTRAYQAASGDNDWGLAIPIIGTADQPAPVGSVNFDVHRVLISDLDDDTTPWRLRLIWGTGTSADAILAGDWSEIVVQANAVPGNRAGGEPADKMMPRVDVGSKVWAQAWNDTNGQVMSFFIGVHGYVG